MPDARSTAAVVWETSLSWYYEGRTDKTEFRALIELWGLDSIHRDHPRFRGEQTGRH
ncbi:hypothetical protein ACFY6T_32405 [[Kitasatospora] papulosa]|uniref:hypothetical protein n=1 Tax=[Kitasatospora] papulosa TaxID=1464011 RepID=UPI0036BB3A64